MLSAPRLSSPRSFWTLLNISSWPYDVFHCALVEVVREEIIYTWFNRSLLQLPTFLYDCAQKLFVQCNQTVRGELKGFMNMRPNSLIYYSAEFIKDWNVYISRTPTYSGDNTEGNERRKAETHIFWLCDEQIL